MLLGTRRTRVIDTPPQNRDPLDERIIGNMVAGYAYVDWLVGAEIDVFAMGHHRHLLELNSLGLFGADAAARTERAAIRAEQRQCR